MLGCMSRGTLLPSDDVGCLPDSMALWNDPDGLRRRLEADGYLFLAGALPTGAVLEARSAVLERLAEVGEVADPVERGIWTGGSLRSERAPDLGAFWQSVSQEPRLRQLTHGAALRNVAERVLGQPAVAHDFLYLRAGVRGRATDLHYDYPFFARTSEETVTVWAALGEVPVELGPLVIVEGSNRFHDLIGQARREGAGLPGARAALDENMLDFARARGARLLTRNFRPGDLVILSMFILHGSLDNHAADNALRLSFDLRFQPAAAERDPRFFGPHPPGITGRGYGELNGAKPLNEEWHQR
jgi:hypothetical protein